MFRPLPPAPDRCPSLSTGPSCTLRSAKQAHYTRRVPECRRGHSRRVAAVAGGPAPSPGRHRRAARRNRRRPGTGRVLRRHHQPHRHQVLLPPSGCRAAVRPGFPGGRGTVSGRLQLGAAQLRRRLKSELRGQFWHQGISWPHVQQPRLAGLFHLPVWP